MEKIRKILFVFYILFGINANGLELTIEPEDVYVELGGSVRLDCQAKSHYGTVNIQWRSSEEGQIINFIGDNYRSQLSNGSLYISNLYPDNDILKHEYQCIASIDNVGSVISRIATIYIAQLSGFEKEPQDITVYLGQIVYFNCYLSNDTPKKYIKVQWLKDEHPLILDEIRMKLLPSGSLEIDDVQSLDSGSYRCNISGFNQYRLSTPGQLTLIDDNYQQINSLPVFIAKPSQQIAIEGSTVTLECTVNGYPKPNVFWLKDGIAVDLAALDSRYQKIASSSLMITDIMESDSGSYQCRAENKKESVDAVAQVIVQVPPRFIKRPHNRIAYENQDLEFECDIYGKPEPKITWLKNGEKITLSEYWQLVNNNNLRINGLLPIDAGIFQCIGVNPAGSVQASARLFVNQSNDTFRLDNLEGRVPSAPRNLSAAIVKTRFVTLRWQEPENINGEQLKYYVYYKQDGSQRERLVNTSHKQEVVIRGLQPGVTYEFRVVAYNSRGPGISSDILSVTTHSEADVPGPPQNLEGYATSSKSIKISWLEPKILNGRISKYVVTMMKDGNESEEKNRSTTSTTCELTDLMPYTEYNIWVHAVNENGPGASTGEITIRTYSAAPSQPPHNISLEAASSTSIIVRWGPPAYGQNGIITGYKIRYRHQDLNNPSSTITTESNQRSFILKGLEKHGIYHVKMCALNVNGTGPWSEWVPIETYENDLDESVVPSSPSNLRTKPMSNSIYISWHPPKDDKIKVRGYIISWGKGYPDVFNTQVDGKQRYYTIESLDPLSDYVISLRATNQAGEGPPIYENVRTTEKLTVESITPLIPPVGLKAIVLSANSVVLYWTDTLLSKSQYITDNRYYVVKYAPYYSQRYKYFNATDLNCMIGDLKPNTQYEFMVKTVKGRRESSWSMMVVNQTQEAAPTSPPRELTILPNEHYSTSVVIKWSPPKQSNGIIIGYNILHSIDNTLPDRHWFSDDFLGNKTEFIVRNLRPATNYYFKIKARNIKGYGPFSSIVSFKTPLSNGMDYSDNLHDQDGRSGMLIYIIIGCSIILITGVAVVIGFMCCRKTTESPDRKKGYIKDTNQKTNIKPPDLWIHHDQMELKALEKTSINGESSIGGGGGGAGGGGGGGGGSSSSGGISNTLPRSGNNDYSQDSMPTNSSSLDKRTYVPSYMGNSDDKCSTLTRQHSRGGKTKLIALPIESVPSNLLLPSASPAIVNSSSLSQPAIHNSCSDVPTSRSLYPRSVAQYSLNRAHITLEPTPESSPDSSSIPSNYEPLQNSIGYSSSGGQLYNTSSSQYAPGHYGSSNPSVVVAAAAGGLSNRDVSGTTSGSGGGGGGGDSAGGSIKRLHGHPLKSFSVPAPPPQSAPSTPAQQKHGISQVTVRPTISGSPFKKQPGSLNQLTKNRLASVNNTCYTPDEIERLKPSYSTEELNQEMANLEGLMKDLNAITASEFEC